MSDSQFPRVSVVTATYNAAPYLVETIESVLSQEYPNLEYIVLDDGSTDDTRQILERYTGRIIWESHPNMGESRTVNKGWEMASGDFVITVSADDPILPNLLLHGVEFMQKHADILVAYPAWEMIDADGQKIHSPQMLDYDYLNMLRWQHCFPGPGSLIRRQAFVLEKTKRNPAYRYIGDFEYWMRLGIHGPFAYLPETLATWRSHSAGTTSTALSNNPQKATEHIQAVRSLYQRPDLPAAAQAIQHEVMATVYYLAGLRCLPQYRHTARLYFLRSLWHSPFKWPQYPAGHTRQPLLMAETILLPAFIRRTLKTLKNRLRGKAE